MNGQILLKAFVPLPAGATAVYAPGTTGPVYYRHSDWLGSSRLATTQSRTMYSDTAYGPFGENYAGSGSPDLNFTGQNQDTIQNYYDFLFREYSQVQGRWMSPDPAGIAVADLGNPQSWNRYAYVTNMPLSLVDPLGLQDNPPMSPCDNKGGCQPPTFDDGPGRVPSGFEYNDSVTVAGPRCDDDGCPKDRSKKSVSKAKPQKACRIVDPVLGALEVTAKIGPEIQIGTTKVGLSMYKNITTGGSGGKAEFNLTWLVSGEADNPTPDGGSFNGGGPGNIQYSVSALGFQYNFTTNDWKFNPAKSFTFGGQVIVGGELSFNPDTYQKLVDANAACRAQGGH